MRVDSFLVSRRAIDGWLAVRFIHKSKLRVPPPPTTPHDKTNTRTHTRTHRLLEWAGSAGGVGQDGRQVRAPRGGEI